MNKEQIKAISTLAVALGALALVFAITFGAVDADALTSAVAAVLAIGTTVVAWWRNNNVTAVSYTHLTRAAREGHWGWARWT